MRNGTTPAPAPMPRTEDLAELWILDAIEHNRETNQREISRHVGISLGLTNLLIHRMVERAWIKVRNAPGRRILHYAVTPRGLAEKVRRAVTFMQASLRYFDDTKALLRDRIRATGIARPKVASATEGEFASLVTQAAKEVGGTYVRLPSNGRGSRPQVIVRFGAATKAEREGWEAMGATLVEIK